MSLKSTYFRRLKIFIIARKGFLFTLFLSTVILLFFYGDLIKSANRIYFGKSGDGLNTYYSSIYHIKYDSSYSHFQGMNYPYGEHVLFTNCIPPISNTIKFISNNIVDVSDYAVGIINLSMLFSLIIAALFLFLIFWEFKINAFYSSIIAVGIAFLSPQINRFGGHYTLSFAFAIPVIIYLLIKFYQRPSWKKSLVTGLFILMMVSFHMYYFAFAAFIIGVFWAVQIFSDRAYRKWKFLLSNIFLQIVLPILLINIWLWLTNSVNDRTTSPWGFLVYKSGWEGIFLQQQDVPDSFLKSFMNPQAVDWEGWAYVGHLASFFYVVIFTLWACIPFVTAGKMGFFLSVLLTGIAFHLIRRKKWNVFLLSQNKLISIFLWTGMITMLFSFAWPFTLFPGILKYAGPVQQFRGIGRFSWIFYYTINIGLFYFIYHLKIRIKWLHFGILGVAVIVLFYDAYLNNRNVSQNLNNEIPSFKESYSNPQSFDSKTLAENYQTFVPVPYFHVGSENLWMESKCESMMNAFTFSLKTGLPMTAVQMARTSISQTYENVSMVLEPYRQLSILDNFKNNKPLLLLVTKCEELNQQDSIIISKADLVRAGEVFDLYELAVEKINHFSDSLYSSVEHEMKSKNLFLSNSFFTEDSIQTFVYNGFESLFTGKSYGDAGALSGNIKEYNTLYDGCIPNAIAGREYILSFWIGKINTDVVPRSTLEIAFNDSAGNVRNAEYNGIHRLFKVIDVPWAMAEYKFSLQEASDKIKLTVFNNDMLQDDTLFIDNLLIRPVDRDVFRVMNETTVVKNNRYYKKN